MDGGIVEREGGIVVVTLNNPERRNALHIPMWEALRALFAKKD